MTHIGLVGATGLVGHKIMQEMDRREMEFDSFRPFASSQSAGKTIAWRGHKWLVEDAYGADYEGLDYVFLSAGGDRTKTAVSRDLCPAITKAGAIAIDNSSAWRDDPLVPLVVMGVNDSDLDDIPKGIVANPNCTTMIALTALGPLDSVAGLAAVNVTSLQSVSGQGYRGIDEALRQIDEMKVDPMLLPTPDVFPTVIAFNVAPHAGTFVGRDTTEEIKFVNESRKIMAYPDLPVMATCYRVPVINVHSLSINAEFRRPVTPEEAEDIWVHTLGVVCAPDMVPQPLITDGCEEVFVGRVRQDHTRTNSLQFCVAGDNLLKGAALNAVQIAEALIRKE
jgi:aspartate-semialdehyde dehydrogenase